MFVWLRLNGIEDAKTFIEQEARDANVLLVPGQVFCPHDKPSPYVRAAFSIASERDMDEGVRRLATLLRKTEHVTPA